METMVPNQYYSERTASRHLITSNHIYTHILSNTTLVIVCHIALTLSCQGLAPFQGRRGLVLLDLFEPRTWHSAGIKKYGPNLKMQKSKHKIFKTVLNWHFFGYYIVVLQNACEMINNI